MNDLAADNVTESLADLAENMRVSYARWLAEQGRAAAEVVEALAAADLINGGTS